MTISIVVFDSSMQVLIQCLSSLFYAISYFRAGNGKDSKVIIYIVNNGETGISGYLRDEGIFRQFEKINSTLRVEEGHGNIGYGQAQNLVLNRDTNDFHVFMNPDVRVAFNSLSEGAEFLKIDPSVMAISPKCRSPKGEFQFLCKTYPSVFELFLRGFAPRSLKEYYRDRLARHEIRNIAWLSHKVGVPIISGCFMFCRKAAIQQVSGFDEKYFLYFEDFDLSLRLGQIGNLAFVGDVMIEHAGGNASKKGLKHILMFMNSAYKFFSTHGWKWL